MHRFFPSGKKQKAAFLLASVLPVATAVIVSLSGCGSGHGASSDPPNYVLPGGLLPTASGSATPTPIGTPDPSASATPTPSGSPTPGMTPTPSGSPSPGGTTAAYTVTPIGQPSGGQYVVPSDLNTAGQAVGYGSSGSVYTAYITTNNAFGAVSALSGRNAIPHAIDDSGNIVGRSRFPSGSVLNAFVLTNGTVRDLGNLGGSSDAYAINRSGQVVGFSYYADANSLPHAFLYDNGAMRDLGTISGGNSSRANDINDAGVVVGNSTVAADFIPHPMVYENGEMREIPAIGGGSRYGFADAINNRGQIVGLAGLSDGSANRPFLYENGVTRDLGTFGGKNGEATDINEAGVIIGYATISSNEEHAFVYQNNTLTDLNEFNPYPTGTSRALSINENGQILLQVHAPLNQSSEQNYVILTPTGRKR